MSGIVENLLTCGDHPRPRSERLAGAEIPRVTRMRAAGQDKTQPVPPPEAIGSGPTFDRDPSRAVCVFRRVARPQANIAIDDLQRAARAVDIAQARIEVRMQTVRTNMNLRLDWPDGFHV